MFEFIRSLVQIVAPIFVVSTMPNVSLTQKLSDIPSIYGTIVSFKGARRYFVVAPLLMIAALYFAGV
jgi:hypothetical protein